MSNARTVSGRAWYTGWLMQRQSRILRLPGRVLALSPTPHHNKLFIDRKIPRHILLVVVGSSGVGKVCSYILCENLASVRHGSSPYGPNDAQTAARLPG
jgi:hypothetical protein